MIAYRSEILTHIRSRVVIAIPNWRRPTEQLGYL